MKPLTEAQLGYIAGIFDGEGCFSIGRAGQGHYYVHAVVTNTDFRLLSWLERVTGLGKVTAVKRMQRRNHKVGGRWTLATAEIRTFLPYLLPHLVIKKEQAQLLLEFADLGKCIPHQRVSDDLSIKRQAIYEEVRELNRKGIP